MVAECEASLTVEQGIKRLSSYELEIRRLHITSRSTLRDACPRIKDVTASTPGSEKMLDLLAV